MSLPYAGSGFRGGPVRHRVAVSGAAPPAPAYADALEALYHEHRVLLLHVATHKFHVPPPDAECLLHDVFLSYMLNSNRIADVRSWLVAAVCNGSRRWYRQHARLTNLGPDIAALILGPRDEGDAVTTYQVREMLARLKPQERELLQRHYYNGETAREIAASTGRSIKSVEKRIVAALRRARQILRW